MKCPNIVELIAVSDDPACMMLAYYEFSFRPFNREVAVNSLDQFLRTLDSEDLFNFFPGICNFIARDIICAVDFLHSMNIVHRDIKPANILVHNMHYSSLQDGEVDMMREKPIICKLADLEGTRSKVIQTNALVTNIRANYFKRGAPAFMAPEIIVPELLLDSASLEELKAIDVWAMLMTIFTCINPDQRYPFQFEIESSLRESGKQPVSIEKMLIGNLRQLKKPSPSSKYLCMQSCYYQSLRRLFYENLKHNPSERCMTNSLLFWKKEEGDLKTIPLEVSQASALQASDLSFIVEAASDTEMPTSTIAPENDGTNSCAFLTLGIIDSLLNWSSDKLVEGDHLFAAVSSVITRFPRAFNKYRDASKMVDISEAAAILSNNGLLSNDIEFHEEIFHNETVYSYAFQKYLENAFFSSQERAMSEGAAVFAVFQATCYLFAIAILPDGQLMAFETHPLDESVGGNGNGIIVISKSVSKFLQWISLRLFTANVSSACTPYLFVVVPKVRLVKSTHILFHQRKVDPLYAEL